MLVYRGMSEIAVVDNRGLFEFERMQQAIRFLVGKTVYSKQEQIPITVQANKHRVRETIAIRSLPSKKGAVSLGGIFSRVFILAFPRLSSTDEGGRTKFIMGGMRKNDHRGLAGL